jgi:hypothetical protein
MSLALGVAAHGCAVWCLDQQQVMPVDAGRRNRCGASAARGHCGWSLPSAGLVASWDDRWVMDGARGAATRFGSSPRCGAGWPRLRMPSPRPWPR